VQAAHPWRPRTSDLCLQSSPTVVHTFIPVVHAKYAWRGGHVQLTSEKIFEVADVSSGWPILGCIESTSAQLMNPGLNRLTSRADEPGRLLPLGRGNGRGLVRYFNRPAS
jgi:hypothetical protein